MKTKPGLKRPKYVTTDFITDALKELGFQTEQLSAAHLSFEADSVVVLHCVYHVSESQLDVFSRHMARRGDKK